jgi:hypothetical protein
MHLRHTVGDEVRVAEALIHSEVQEMTKRLLRWTLSFKPGYPLTNLCVVNKPAQGHHDRFMPLFRTSFKEIELVLKPVELLIQLIDFAVYAIDPLFKHIESHFDLAQLRRKKILKNFPGIFHCAHRPSAYDVDLID